METALQTPRPSSERLHPLLDPLPSSQVRVVAGPTCPLCLEPVTALPRLEVCPECHSIHHWSCVVEMRRCGTIGCAGLASRAVEPESRTLAAIAFVTNVIGAAFVGPLVVWFIAKSRGDAYARYQARQALFLALAASVLAIPTLGLAAIAMVVLSIVGAVKTWRGEWFRLPVVGARPPAEATPRESRPKQATKR